MRFRRLRVSEDWKTTLLKRNLSFCLSSYICCFLSRHCTSANYTHTTICYKRSEIFSFMIGSTAGWKLNFTSHSTNNFGFSLSEQAKNTSHVIQFPAVVSICCQVKIQMLAVSNAPLHIEHCAHNLCCKSFNQ